MTSPQERILDLLRLEQRPMARQEIEEILGQRCRGSLKLLEFRGVVESLRGDRWRAIPPKS